MPSIKQGNKIKINNNNAIVLSWTALVDEVI
jgi:hypothetical protein